MTRFDILSPRPRKDGKTYWHKVGAMFNRDKGGFSATLDSLPIPDAEGRVTLLIVEPREQGQQQSQQQGGGGLPDDEVPF